MTPRRHSLPRLCAALGIARCEEHRYPVGSFGWTGRALYRHCSEADGFHEVAHWLLATPEQRASATFGLPVAEDATASALGILLHAQWSRRGAREHARDHNWLEHVDEPRWTWAGVQRLLDSMLLDPLEPWARDTLPVALETLARCGVALGRVG